MNGLRNSLFACALLLCVGCSLLTGCKKAANDAPEATVSLQAAQPVLGEISEQIAADATLAPLAQAAITPRFSAPIRAEYVQRGARVKRGQLLMSLEARDLQGSALDSRGAVESAQANYTTTVQASVPEDLKKAQGDVEQAKASRDVAKRAADERRQLFQQGAISGRDADAAYATLVQADATLAQASKRLQDVELTTSRTNSQAAQGQLVSARGRLQNAEAQVGYALLRSPIDGVVTDRPLFPGETAQSGSTVITIMDTSSLLAKLHLAQSIAQQLALGRPAQVTIPGIPDPVTAAVSFISPALDPGSTTVEVWLKLGNADGRFKVGTPVHAVITGRTLHTALTVPASALVPGRESGSAVMLVGADGAAHSRAVQVGLRTPQTVQVLSGLSATDKVITDGGYGLDDGTKVQVEAGEAEGKQSDAAGSQPATGKAAATGHGAKE